jgi:phosphomannomutase/phosphoglucomutase
LLEIISRSDKTLSGLLSDVPKTWTTPEIRVDCPDEKKFAVVERIQRIFREKYRIIDIDGARILMPGGWGLVRASNTQPVLVLRFEADSEQRLEELKKEVSSVVERIIAE